MKFNLKVICAFALILNTYFILKASGQDDAEEVEDAGNAEEHKEAYNYAYFLKEEEPYYSSIYDCHAEFKKAYETFTQNNWPDPDNYIELSYRWYNLLINVYDMLSSWRIQNDRFKYETASIVEKCRREGTWEMEGGEMFHVVRMFPEMQQNPDYRYIRGHTISELKVKAFCDLFQVTLAFPRYNLTRPTPEGLRVEADFVVSGDIQLLYNTIYANINTVEVFTLNKFIVDSDLSFNSEKPFAMFVTAPRWDVFTRDELIINTHLPDNWEPSFDIGSQSNGSSFLGMGMEFRQMAGRLEIAIEPQPRTNEYISLYQLVPPEEVQELRSAGRTALTSRNPSADINYNYHATMNEYEKYLLENRKDFYRNALLTEYFVKIYTYPNFKSSLFNIQGFVEEINLLENNFLFLERDNIPLESIYTTLKWRFHDYSRRPKAGEGGSKYAEVRHCIKEALESKIDVVTSGDGLVVNLAEFLNDIIKQAEDMKDIVEREKAQKIMMYNKNMKDNILYEIIRVKSFIDEQVMPQLGLTNDQLDQRINDLLDKIMYLKGEARKTIRIREQEKKNLAEVQATKRTFAVLSAIGGALLAFGTMGGGAFIWIGGTITSINALVDKVDDPEITEKLKMSEGMTNVQHFIDSKARTLEKLLESLDDRYPEVLGSLKTGIEEIRTTLLEGVDNGPFDEVQKLLNSKEEQLQSSSSSPEGALELVRELKRAIEIAQVSSADVYLKYYRNDTALRVLSELTSEQDPEEIKALNQYERNIHALLVPAIKYLRNVTMSVTNMTDTKSLARIDIARWRANDVVEDIYFRVKEFTDGWYQGRMLLMVLDKLKRALGLVFSLLSRITSYVQYGQLIDYISNINAVKYETSLEGDPELINIVTKMKYIKKYNTAIAQYNLAQNSYRLYAFPFMQMLDAVDNLDIMMDDKEMTIQDLAYHAELQLGYLNMKMNRYKQNIIREEDASVFEADFDGSSPRKPVFFKWNLRESPEDVEKLFSGQPVKLFADVKQSVHRNAIKFNKIEFRLKLDTAEDQAEVDNALAAAYNLQFTHSGESYFRCDQDFFKTKSTSLTFYYSFKKDDTDLPTVIGSSYKKLLNGDYLLSPYTEWTINIVSDNANDFAALESFKTKSMDIELIGRGQYVQGPKLCSKYLFEYYEVVE